jgi:tRNA(fMet)-specific endonuclease VapC
MARKHLILDSIVVTRLYGNCPEVERVQGLLRDAALALAFASVADLHSAAQRNEWGDPRISHLVSYLRRRFVVLPYHDELPRVWARLRRHAERTGHALREPGSTNDLWVAACAVNYKMPLVTENVDRFLGLPGLEVLGPDD